MNKLASWSLLLTLLAPFTSWAGESNVVRQGQAVGVINIFVCVKLADAKAIVDAIAANDGKKFAEVTVPLQEQGKCGLARGVVVYQTTAYENKDTEFRVLSFNPANSDAVFYEVTDWRIHLDTI